MLISERYNFVYLANPKTGSTSIEAAFGKYADYRSASGPRAKHITVRVFKRKFRFFESLEKVVCVRDPLSTLHSWYRYRQRENSARPQNMVPDVSFEEFLHHWSQDKPPAFADVSSGIAFILNKDGTLPNISYFRYEGTPTLHAYLASKVGEDVPEMNLNRSSVPEGNTLLDPDDRNIPKLDKVYDIYRRISFNRASKVDEDDSGKMPSRSSVPQAEALPDPADLNIPKLDRIYDIYRRISFKNDGATLEEMLSSSETEAAGNRSTGKRRGTAGKPAGNKGQQDKRRKRRRAARKASEDADA